MCMIALKIIEEWSSENFVFEQLAVLPLSLLAVCSKELARVRRGSAEKKVSWESNF